VVVAHAETVQLRIAVAYPAHEPREADPHYAAFHAARTRLARLGRLVCWIGNADCDHAHPVELHHDKVEFSLIQDVDPARFAEAYGLHLADDAAFLDYVESEGNLLPLCVFHHRGHGGIHVLPYPWWVVQRYLRDGVAAPARQVGPD
jgi:hypothetical protein